LLGAAAGAGTTALLGDLAFLRSVEPVRAEDAKVSPEHVVFSAEIEPLVRLLEDTPRDQLLEKVGAQIRRGTPYRSLLTAVMLAGVRNVQPHPVGFKFHAVLVVNSAHLASLASPDADRWLPLFWALDSFKSAQAQDEKEGNWTMPALRDTSLPSATQARQQFVQAMDRWDEPAADRAAAQLARVTSSTELWELFWRYGARDFRDIGHKAIYAANAWRTLEVIGWQHAEPVVRSLTLALLDRGGTKGSPADLDDPADRPWRANLQRVKEIRPDWAAGRADAESARDVLEAIRGGGPDEAAKAVVALLNRGVSASSAWDAVLAASGELLMRKPGIVGIHCVTSANALRYAFQTSGNPETRLLTLLQGAAYMSMFRQSMGLGADNGPRIDRIEPSTDKEQGAEAIEAIFASVNRDRMQAARRTLAYLNGGGSPEELLTAARRLIFLKGSNAHDYKFSSAALEDYYHVSPTWRNRYLATAMFNLRGSGGADNPLVARTRAALTTG